MIEFKITCNKISNKLKYQNVRDAQNFAISMLQNVGDTVYISYQKCPRILTTTKLLTVDGKPRYKFDSMLANDPRNKKYL